MLFFSVPLNSWLGMCFKCEDQAAAVNAQLDGMEISVCRQHPGRISLYYTLASDCRLT